MLCFSEIFQDGRENRVQSEKWGYFDSQVVPIVDSFAAPLYVMKRLCPPQFFYFNASNHFHSIA
jgi:hypothetical protein